MTNIATVWMICDVRRVDQNRVGEGAGASCITSISTKCLPGNGRISALRRCWRWRGLLA